MKKIILFAFILLMSTSSWAYIPPYWMIMSRVTENHGKGLYAIDQDVIFPSENGPIIINERWTVLNEDQLRVEVTGRREFSNQINLVFIYDQNRKHFIGDDGQKKSMRTPHEFFEPVFHFRQSKEIKPYLVAQKIVPTETLRSEPHKFSNKNPHPAEETYVRLGRLAGVVNYIVGLATLPNSATKSPGLWIEQDQFNIRQIRYPSQLQITAPTYSTFSQGFQFPKERDVSFNNVNIKIVTNSVTSIANSGDNKSKLSPQSLLQMKDYKPRWPDETTIKNFYSQLR